jgi:hypothetical protein
MHIQQSIPPHQLQQIQRLQVASTFDSHENQNPVTCLRSDHFVAFYLEQDAYAFESSVEPESRECLKDVLEACVLLYLPSFDKEDSMIYSIGVRMLAIVATFIIGRYLSWLSLPTSCQTSTVSQSKNFNGRFVDVTLLCFRYSKIVAIFSFVKSTTLPNPTSRRDQISPEDLTTQAVWDIRSFRNKKVDTENFLFLFVELRRFASPLVLRRESTFHYFQPLARVYQTWKTNFR